MLDAPRIGVLDSGLRNSIADVSQVTVGHVTLARGPIQTGVTVVRPHAGDLYREPLPAASVVVNGFGKTLGLVQLDELGMLESPIALTNTFAVGTIATAMIRHALTTNPTIGRTSPTLNPIVAECNDGWLNDLQAFAIEEPHYAMAFDAASSDLAQGAVGAGRGMSCFELKGGIGSASRMASVAGTSHTVGVVVLANFGRLAQLTLCGVAVGSILAGRGIASRFGIDMDSMSPSRIEEGSIIVALATDAPLEHRQLRRLGVRAAAGIARTGSNFGHGSGDISIAFSTAEPMARGAAATTRRTLRDDALDPLFDAAAEATEQSIVNALFAAEAVEGRDDRVRQAIAALLPDWHARLRDAARAGSPPATDLNGRE